MTAISLKRASLSPARRAGHGRLPTATILHPVAASRTVAVEQSRESEPQLNGGFWRVARGQPWLTASKHRSPTPGSCMGFVQPRLPLTSPPRLCEDAGRWAHVKAMTKTADHSRLPMNNMERIDQILGARH